MELKLNTNKLRAFKDWCVNEKQTVEGLCQELLTEAVERFENDELAECDYDDEYYLCQAKEITQ